MFKLLIWMCITTIVIASHVSKKWNFKGNQFWNENALELCQTDTIRKSNDAELICTRYFVDYTFQNVEVLSSNPIVLHFHNFFAESDAAVFVKELEEIKLEALKVSRSTETVIKENSFGEERLANGTWIGHEELNQSKKMFGIAERRMPSVNFRTAESWQAVSYRIGGHYVPHYDYLEYNPNNKDDWWAINRGPRAATFFTILHTAEAGGGTVFPRIGLTVNPKAGDVIFWFNELVNSTKELNSLHGGCPILKGQKIVATLWIHLVGNELNFKALNENFFDIKVFTKQQCTKK